LDQAARKGYSEEASFEQTSDWRQEQGPAVEYLGGVHCRQMDKASTKAMWDCG
jgi:hypothetical protein